MIIIHSCNVNFSVLDLQYWYILLLQGIFPCFVLLILTAKFHERKVSSVGDIPESLTPCIKTYNKLY